MKKKTRPKTKANTPKKGKPRKAASAKTKGQATSSVRQAKGKASAKKVSKAGDRKSRGSSGRPGVIAPVNSVFLGVVEDYYAKIGVIALTLKAPLALGQQIQVLGHTTDFQQPVDSMQIDHAALTLAKAKDGVGIKVVSRARSGDHVYLLK